MNNDVRRKFAEHVYGLMKSAITGADCERAYNNKPHDQFFAGTLCTRNPRATPGDIRTKVAPVKMGVEFLLRKSDLPLAEISIAPSFSVFWKVFPTYKEQLDAALAKHQAMERIAELAADPQTDVREAPKMKPVFRKFSPAPVIVKCRPSAIAKEDGKTLQSFPEIGQMLEECSKAWDDDPNTYVSKKTQKEELASVVPLSALQSDEEFERFRDEWGMEKGKDQKPMWGCELSIRIYDFSAECVKVSVTLENTSTEPGNPHTDNYLFDTALKVEVDGCQIEQYEIDYLNDHYRYDGSMGAIGINCEALLAPDRKSVASESVPSYRQMRMKARSTVAPKFKDLASSSAVPTLRELAKAMRDYIADYEEGKKHIVDKSSLGQQRYQEDLDSFMQEIERFESGIKVLEDFPDALRAFQLMNRSFQRSSESRANQKDYDAWRAFQIIFIVMNVPDVVSTEHEVKSRFEDVEVLYFPTGGGKTETYLGLAVFTLFFDRIRGKKFGTSVITRFPLRLLSLQQIQRTADIIANAELVRREEKISGDWFSLGYYVGKSNTPNKLMDKQSIFGGQDFDILSDIIAEREKVDSGEISGEDIVNDEVVASREHLIITRCPFCGSDKMLIDGDKDRIRLMHRCLNDGCPWPKSEELPIYVSDMEVYRYLPSIIISTLDKIAICGYQKNFRNMFGCVKTKCPKHGYSSSDECTEKYLCNVPKDQLEKVEPHDGVPTLLVQDELHLVRESLGTYDAHYESFIEQYARELTGGKRSIKVIAATATISEYRIQTNHLYARGASRYPAQGPNIRESFYSQIDDADLSRLVIGITPHDKTIIFSVLEVIRIYHEIVQERISNPEKLVEELDGIATADEVRKMLDDYKTMLSYHIAKSDGDSIANSTRSMVNRALRAKNMKEIKPRPMTGDVMFSNVRKVLEELEKSHDSDEAWLINATSMISHGVDLDMLNFMVFMGMPNNTAEYIQASSRVGRKYPGLVVIVFNPTRERDQSYFKFFSKYHEYRDLLVEAVPINRWAKFSIKRTLPGLYAASIMNLFDLRQTSSAKAINMSAAFKKAYEAGEISEETLSDFLKKSYKVDPQNPMSTSFGEEIDQKVERYTDAILDALANQFIAMRMPDPPMRSLRDVDELVDVALSFEGQRALSDIRAERTAYFQDDDEEETEVVQE